MTKSMFIFSATLLSLLWFGKLKLNDRFSILSGNWFCCRFVSEFLYSAELLTNRFRSVSCVALMKLLDWIVGSVAPASPSHRMREVLSLAGVLELIVSAALMSEVWQWWFFGVTSGFQTPQLANRTTGAVPGAENQTYTLIVLSLIMWH